MNQELTEKLYKDFPGLYRQHTLPMQETCLCWGFECGSGWFQIIYDLSKKLMEVDPDIQAIQVKEKFGGLRFYTGGVNTIVADQVYAAISDAEELSYKTCEQCGRPGQPNEAGWITTLCEVCREARRPGD